MSHSEAELLDELVLANHILADRGVLDAFGHVSARLPGGTDQFILARSMAPALVTADDILAFDLNGDEVTGDSRPGYLERFIHSELYRARPDAMAVVHSHSPSVVPFSVVPSVPLRPVSHMAGFLGGASPVYEIRDHSGEGSNLLIINGHLGASLARTLGQRTAILMRGHGSAVVGATLREAVFHAVYLEVNARLQIEALRLGPVTFLSEQEAAASAETNRGQMNRAWETWSLDASMHGYPAGASA
jgi:ribulose-5-phosphate 4-epimerase/fuculose-1-phosphate aldolase